MKRRILSILLSLTLCVGLLPSAMADHVCVDEDNDHLCDQCFELVEGLCSDGNGDHCCDECGYLIGECVDSDHDHYCDTCGQIWYTLDDEGACQSCGAVEVWLTGEYHELSYHPAQNGSALADCKAYIYVDIPVDTEESCPRGEVLFCWLDEYGQPVEGMPPVTEELVEGCAAFTFTDLPADALNQGYARFIPADDTFLPASNGVILEYQDFVYRLSVDAYTDWTINGTTESFLWVPLYTPVTITLTGETQEGYAWTFDGENGVRPDDANVEGSTLSFTMPDGDVSVCTADAFNVWVGDVRVTPGNCSDVLGDGKVSYEPSSGVLTLNGASITSGTSNGEGLAGIYCRGDLVIELAGANTVDLSASSCEGYNLGIGTSGALTLIGSGSLSVASGSATAASVGIYSVGDLSIEDCSVSAQGGSGVGSFGIAAMQRLEILSADVRSTGGSAANEDGEAVSAGAVCHNFLSVADRSNLTATGGQATGLTAISAGLKGQGDEDNYINYTADNSYVEAIGGQAVGSRLAHSAGCYLVQGGVYPYEQAATMVFTAGSAQSDAQAHSNGVYLYGGSLDVDSGQITISGGQWTAPQGSGYGLYALGMADEYVVSGGTFSIASENAVPNPYSAGLLATKVTVSAISGPAVYAQVGLDLDGSVAVTAPSQGDVSGMGGEPESYEYDYYTVTDADGAAASQVVIEAVICSVRLEGLSYTRRILVPVDCSINEIYCDFYEVEDMSQIFKTEKEGYTFLGWFTDSGEQFSFDDAIEADMTLTAKWEKNAVVPPVVYPTLPSVPSAPSVPSLPQYPVFADVAADAWYADAVAYVTSRDIMNGVGDGRFDPDGSTSRAMVAATLWRLEGCPVVNYLMLYEDVGPDMWYTEAIRWASAMGIVEGYGDTFAPMDSITREQLAVMLYRYEQHKGGGFTGSWMFLLNATDRVDVSPWAYEAMCWMNMNKIIVGDGTGAVLPKEGATRAETAQVLMKYLEK